MIAAASFVERRPHGAPEQTAQRQTSSGRKPFGHAPSRPARATSPRAGCPGEGGGRPRQGCRTTRPSLHGAPRLPRCLLEACRRRRGTASARACASAAGRPERPPDSGGRRRRERRGRNAARSAVSGCSASSSSARQKRSSSSADERIDQDDRVLLESVRGHPAQPSWLPSSSVHSGCAASRQRLGASSVTFTRSLPAARSGRPRSSAGERVGADRGGSALALPEADVLDVGTRGRGGEER
jgi:hypothetical protein